MSPAPCEGVKYFLLAVMKSSSATAGRAGSKP